MKHKLTKPIVDGDKSWPELDLREITLGDLIAADIVSPQSENMRSAAMVSNMTGVPIPALKQISAHEFSDICTLIMGASGNSSAPAIGERSPA